MLLAIISTAAGVIGALSGAISALQQRRRAQPRTVVIIVTNVEALTAEPQTDHPSESDLKFDSALS